MLVTPYGGDPVWNEGRHTVSVPLSHRILERRVRRQSQLWSIPWTPVTGTWFIRHARSKIHCSVPITHLPSSQTSGTEPKMNAYKSALEQGILRYFTLQITGWLYFSGKKGSWFWHPTPHSSKHSIFSRSFWLYQDIWPGGPQQGGGGGLPLVPSPVRPEGFLRSTACPLSEDKVNEAVMALEEVGHRGELIAVEESSGLVFVILSNRIICQSWSAGCLRAWSIPFSVPSLIYNSQQTFGITVLRIYALLSSRPKRIWSSLSPLRLMCLGPKTLQNAFGFVFANQNVSWEIRENKQSRRESQSWARGHVCPSVLETSFCCGHPGGKGVTLQKMISVALFWRTGPDTLLTRAESPSRCAVALWKGQGCLVPCVTDIIYHTCHFGNH